MNKKLFWILLISYSIYLESQNNAFDLATKTKTPNLQLIETLLIEGANVNELFSDNTLAITRAIGNIDVQMVKLLLRYHANLNISVAIYDNVIDWAQRFKRWMFWYDCPAALDEIIKLLEEDWQKKNPQI